MTTPIDTILVAGSRAAGVSGNLLRDYVESVAGKVRFQERDSAGEVQTVEVNVGLPMMQAVPNIRNVDIKSPLVLHREIIAPPGINKYINIEQIWDKKVGAEQLSTITNIYQYRATSVNDMLDSAEIAALSPVRRTRNGVLEDDPYLYDILPYSGRPTRQSITSFPYGEFSGDERYLYFGCSIYAPDLVLNYIYGSNGSSIGGRLSEDDYVSIAGTVMVGEDEVKLWRTTVRYDAATYSGGRLSASWHTNGPSGYSVNSEPPDIVIGFPSIAPGITRPLLRGDMERTIWRKDVSEIARTPNGAIEASSLGRQPLLENRGLILAYSTYYESMDDFLEVWTADIYDKWVSTFLITYYSVLIRYTIHDTHNAP